MRQLAGMFKEGGLALIVIQDYPDPDAIASAAGFKALANALANIQCTIVYGGIVGRAENQALVKYLDLNLRRIEDVDIRRFDMVALLDCQPQTGNNRLPDEVVPDVVIDHHPVRSNTRRSPFTDIRGKYGATSTILYEYLREAGVDIDVPLATSLLYGIRSDTQDLGRETTQADIEAFLALYPSANKRMLSRIQCGRVPDDYFRMLFDAIREARIYDDCVVTNLGRIDNPDMIGEVADLMLRRRETSWVLCLGFREGTALFSLRTSAQDGNAGVVARGIAGREGSGGGHTALAAGKIPLTSDTEEDRRKKAVQIRDRFLKTLRKKQFEGTSLV